jgi:hypothetical protein
MLEDYIVIKRLIFIMKVEGFTIHQDKSIKKLNFKGR